MFNGTHLDELGYLYIVLTSLDTQSRRLDPGGKRDNATRTEAVEPEGSIRPCLPYEESLPGMNNITREEMVADCS